MTEASLALPDLERFYDDLAAAIDQAGTKDRLLLAKLVLLMANRLGDADTLTALLDCAKQDLGSPPVEG